MHPDAYRSARLWQAVVVQAVRDACSDPGVEPPPGRWRRAAMSEWRVRQRDRDAARAWLLHNKDDFLAVCSLAGFNPEYVRDRAARLRALGWPMPSDIEEID